MRSVTSYFDRAVFKKTLKRFWPIWAANLVAWLLVFPLNLLARIQNGEDVSYMTARLMRDTSVFLVIGSIALAAMTAMAVCSHLYQARSANFFGALPTRREGVFLSVYLAGLCMMLGPNLVIFALMIPVELLGHALMMTPLLVWLAATCVMELFFFSFAVFCGMFTGHILALPVFFGVFNALAAAAYAVGLFIAREFYYGFAYSEGSLLERIVLWLTPAYQLTQVSCGPADRTLERFEIEGGGVLIVYAVAALVFAVAALLLYRRRQMETAGDVVAVPAMRPVFRYGVAVCTGVLFGLATSAILNLGELGLMASMVIWAVAGCFVAQMLLDKTPKVFRKWKGSAAIALAFIAAFVVIGFDLTGYETRVPQSGQVASAEVTGLRCAPYDSGSYWSNETVTDPEMVETVVQLHRKAVELRDKWALPRGDYIGWNFEVTYTLQNGKKLARQYTLYDNRYDSNGVIALIQKLVDDPALTRERYGVDEMQEELDKGGRLECGVYLETRESATEQDSVTYYRYGSVSTSTEDPAVVQEEQYYTEAEALALWQAVLRDLDEGDIGAHDAGDVRTNGRGERWMEFTVRAPQRVQVSATGADATQAAVYRNLTISLPNTARHTLEVLEGLEGQD